MKSCIQKLFFALAIFAGVHQTNAATVFPIATNPAIIQFSDGIAFDGSNYLVEEMTGTNSSEVTNVSVQLVSSSGTPLGSQTIVGGGGSLRTTVGLAFGQTNYLVVWSDSTVSSGVSMFGQFISRVGAKVGPAFTLLASQGSYGLQTVKALATDGTNFLIVWQDDNDDNLYGQLVTTAGTLSGAAFLISSQQQNSPQVAVKFGETNYLVVWESGNGSTVQSQTFAESIAGNGSAGSPFQISQTASTDQEKVGGMAVAFDGTNYLAAWNLETIPETDLPNNTNWLIYGRLVSQSGTFPGSEVALFTNLNQLVPELAFDGANYLLACGFDSNTTNSDVNLRCQFLDRSANLVGTIFTPFAAQGTNLPIFALNGLLFDGIRFAVAAALGTLDPSGSPASGEVFGAFIPASTTSPTLTASNHVGTQFPLQLTGTPGINYAIQVTTNLSAANWTAIVTNSATNGTFSFSFTDTSATNKGRFYRAVMQ